MTHPPADIVLAHQYLYYVLARPVWSDYTYDAYCQRNHIAGGGGSDRAADYDSRIVALANDLLDHPTDYRGDDAGECI